MWQRILAQLLLLAVLTSPTQVGCSDVAFSADLRASASPLTGAVYDSFGSSHGSTTLRARWRDHLTTTAQDIPFSRIRFHGLLDDDMWGLWRGKPQSRVATPLSPQRHSAHGHAEA